MAVLRVAIMSSPHASHGPVLQTFPRRRCEEKRGRWCIPSAPGRRLFALVLATYQQHGSMPAQHAAPATQQLAAKAVAENVEAPIAATALRYMNFMELLQLIDIDGRFDRT